MPLLNHIPIGKGFLAVWRREESTAQLLGRVALSPTEQAYYEKIAHQPRRRKEWLTWHGMIREGLGEHVSADYDASGQPVLVGHAGHISVSHTKDLVVLYYQPERCGVDIEEVERNFGRVSGRYISAEEWALPQADREDDRFLALMWCAKETAYKYAGKQGVDLLKDIRVTRIDTARSTVDVSMAGTGRILLKYRFFQQHCLAYTLPAPE